MPGPQRPLASSPGPYNASPFTVPASGAPIDPKKPESSGRKFLTWRMLRLVAALVALLAVIILGIQILFPPPEPIGTDNTIPVDITPSQTINSQDFASLLDSGIALYDASLADSGGVNTALTSHLLAGSNNSLLQASFDTEGNHVVSSFDLLAEPTPIRFTRNGTTFINTITPYPANTAIVAKIRDSEFVGEWSLANANDPTTTLPTLPQLAKLMAEGMKTATIGTSPDGLITQVIIKQDGLTASAIPNGLLSRDIDGETQISYLFDKDKRLVGLSITGPEAREGDGNAPQIVYSVPVEGFTTVEVPDIPENPGVAPDNLAATGPWSNLVALATDIQTSAREAAASTDTDSPTIDYTPELAQQVLSESRISEQLSATRSSFDPATNLLKDSDGRIVCLPLGVINPGADVGRDAPMLYLDLCPILPEGTATEQS